MKRSILKPIIAGVLIGTAAFFAPFFLLKAVFFFLIIGSIIRMFMWRRYYGGGPRYYLAYADKIRGMSEEEYSAFKNKINTWSHSCGNRHGWKNHGCHNRQEWRECDNQSGNSSTNNNETKKD